jgi:sugar O-acyltransferase (sialic acid O-acetyltransferase NeuD family)
VERIVVIGGGGHAKVLISTLKKASWEIVGYTDPVDRGVVLGVPYLGTDSILPDLLLRAGECWAVLGLGKVGISRNRIRLQEQLEAAGLRFPVVISPCAVLNEEAELGLGTVVLDGAVVGTGTVAGKACILNTNSTVEHDCRMGNDVHIAPGAVLGGGVTISSGCMIGAGATVIQGLTICEDCLIGAGATVVKDIDSPGTYIGNPARISG